MSKTALAPRLVRSMATGLWCVQVLLAQAAGPARGCPADFPEFLNRFETSTPFRRQHTHFPLPLERTDTTVQPVPSRVQVLVRRSQHEKYPSTQFPPPPPVSGAPLVRQPTRAEGDARWVRYERPGPDAYALEYVFRPGRRCWQLTEVHHIVL